MEAGSMYCAEQINVPKELSTIMKHYTKAVIVQEPPNLYKWSANYFAALANLPPIFGDDGTYLQAPAASQAANQAPPSPTKQEKIDRQQQQHKEAVEDDATPAQLIQLADDLCENGQYPKALEYLNEAVAIDPNNAEIYFKRGILKHHFMQDIDGGYQDYSDCINLNPTYCDAYRYRADLLHFHTQNLQESLDDYNNAIQLGRSDADSFTCRGELHRKMGNLAEALADLNDALKLDETFADAYKCRADLMHWQHGELEKGLEDYNKAAELGRGDSDLLANRGELLRKMGETEGALQDLNDALQGDPNCVEAYQYRAMLFADSDPGAALEDARVAVDLGSQDQEFLAFKEELEARAGQEPGSEAAESP
eukprot:TRINITY_DN62896_c0_g1_i1.p2 TRINITY_DN62896_c0_g1~~TRINITY_DN62896_c0_g1_i1.p2  ORF type:complete len:367 (-),score=47.00 TRINITY_DN62896_c0_g1_i1:1892-2992(-)